MKNIEIQKAKSNDIPEIIDIWYKASIQAHGFISVNYWKANKQLMKDKYLPKADTFIATNQEKILGFISLSNSYIAALFVKPEEQGKGFGNALLNYAKINHNSLQLKVFCKNKKSIEFYKSKGFVVISESKDEETSENEFIMQWQK